MCSMKEKGEEEAEEEEEEEEEEGGEAEANRASLCKRRIIFERPCTQILLSDASSCQADCNKRMTMVAKAN